MYIIDRVHFDEVYSTDIGGCYRGGPGCVEWRDTGGDCWWYIRCRQWSTDPGTGSERENSENTYCIDPGRCSGTDQGWTGRSEELDSEGFGWILFTIKVVYDWPGGLPGSSDFIYQAQD